MFTVITLTWIIFKVNKGGDDGVSANQIVNITWSFPLMLYPVLEIGS